MELLSVLALLFTPPYMSVETRERVVIIDTGIKSVAAFNDAEYCKDGHADFTGRGFKDVLGHGSNINAIIASELSSKRCITIIKATHNSHSYPSIMDMASMYKHILALRPAWLNYSASGEWKWSGEELFLQQLATLGTTMTIAAGNNGLNLSEQCNIYPACYKVAANFYVVANGSAQKLHPASNYGGPVNARQYGVKVDAGGWVMTGTSQAAALHLIHLMRKKDGL